MDQIKATPLRRSKRILAAAMGSITLLAPTGEAQTTYSFTNGGGSGGNLWAANGNWSAPGVPTDSSLVYIPADVLGAAGSLFITTGSNGTLSTSAAVGTLLFNAAVIDEYETIRASNSGSSSLARDATITFGSSSAAGGLELDPDGGFSGFFQFGGYDVTNDGTLITAVPRALVLRSAARTDGALAMVLATRIVGDGSVTLARLSGYSEDAAFQEGFPLSHSTFAGGTQIDTGASLRIFSDSEQNGSLEVQSGPLGRGTSTLNGGTLILDSSVATITIANAVSAAAQSTIVSTGNKEARLVGPVRTGASGAQRMRVKADRSLVFDDATWTSTDTGTISFLDAAQDEARFVVSSANAGTGSYGGFVGEGTSGSLLGTVVKEGSGTFGASHFRVGTLSVQGGLLRVNPEFTGGRSGAFGDANDVDEHTSRVNTLTLAVDMNGVPSVKLDLTNNALIVDHGGTSPFAGTLTSGAANWIKNAWANGNWNGNGITTEYGNTGTVAIGYGEASVNYGISGSGTATFEHQTVDATSGLIRVTRYGDADLDGQATLADYARLSVNFNQPGYWTEGDFNYDGSVTIADYGLYTPNYNQSALQRPGDLPPLADLYIAMLDSPAIYWEARLWPEFWDRYFAQFEGMNLGAPPAVPAYLLARGIPEPATGVVLAGLVAVRRRRVS